MPQVQKLRLQTGQLLDAMNRPIGPIGNRVAARDTLEGMKSEMRGVNSASMACNSTDISEALRTSEVRGHLQGLLLGRQAAVTPRMCCAHRPGYTMRTVCRTISRPCCLEQPKAAGPYASRG